MPANRKLPPDDEMIALYRSGMSCGEIGEHYGCGAKSACSLLRRIGEPRRSLSEAARLAGTRGRAKGRFTKRNVPWNKGLTGTHFSPETEFKPGHASNNRYPIGTVRVRIRRRGGKLHHARAYVKVGQPSRWRLRCRVNWEAEHGPIPRGMLIRHRSADGMDDRLSNLVLANRAEHLTMSRRECEDTRRARASKATKRRWANYRCDAALAAINS